MQNAFEIKGIRIGDGQPVICVPVVALKKEEVITNIRFLAEQKVQMIEWRVDCFEEVDDFHAVSEVLQVIRPVLEHTIFLFTFRTKQQGGSRRMEEWKILKLNELAAQRGEKLADMALGWLLQKEEVTSVLIGASKPQQILDNIKAVSCAPFTKEELKQIDEISLN